MKVSNAKEFYDVARKLSEKIEILLVTKSDIDQNKAMLNERWEKLNAWEGIRSCHFFRPDDKRTIQAATTSRLDGLRVYEIFQRDDAKLKIVKKKPPKYVKKTTEEKKLEALDKKKRIDEKKQIAQAKKAAAQEKKIVTQNKKILAEEKKKVAQEKKNAAHEKKKVAQHRIVKKKNH